MFISGQEFNEAPDGVRTQFTSSKAFVRDSLIITQGGLTVHNFTYVNATTVNFGEPPNAADGELRWAGHVLEGVPVATQGSFLTGIAQRIQDEEHKLDDATLISCLQQAVEEYSQRRPRNCVADVVGTGTAFLALPAAWEDGFSLLSGIERITDDETPEPLRSYQLNQTPDGTNILFAYGYAESGVTYRVHYSARHTVNADGSTVPSADEAALMDLAASHALLRMAAAYTQTIDQTIGSEVISFRDKADKYRSLSKDFRTRYEQAVTAAAHTGAGGQRSWQREQQLLFHR